MLYKHLRHQYKRYRKRYGSSQRELPIKNKKFIDERPKIVDDKSSMGDWGLDTIIETSRKQAIVTMVERVSKLSVLKKVINKTAQQVKNATVDGLQPYSNFLFTLTSDGVMEFAYHEKICKELNADFYFSHPYSSWERELNENTNGLIPQYLQRL